MDIKILIKNLTWFNLVEKLKVILNKLVASAFVDAPSDGNQYARQDGEWEQITIPSAGVESVTGDYVDNTDPLNPILGDPRPYKVYTALLTQTGTNAPVATVLENTIGNIVWTRSASGLYVATLAGAFTSNKTFASASFSFEDARDGSKSIGISANGVNQVQLRTSDAVVGGASTDDLMLEPTSIEIRVYN